MNDYKHFCVIDAEGNYKTFVLVLLEPGEDEMPQEKIQYYELLEGKSLVDTAPPSTRPYTGAMGLVRPRWDDETGAWVEGATNEEIVAWEAEHPAPEATVPTPDEQMRADIDYLAALGGVVL